VGDTHYRFLRAKSVEEAIALVSNGSVDLVLADGGIRHPGAIDLCRILKRSSATQLFPVFVLWPQSDPDAEVRAIEAGADAFLPAPIQPGKFHAHVRSALRRKALIDRLDDSETILVSLAASVEERDDALGKHCERLARIACSIGLELQLPAADILALQRGGYLHDIGKVAVPDQILLKAGPLTPEEWRVMESHTVKGEQICKGLKSLGKVLPIIRNHHEKWDGSGYPDRLRGEQIPLLARIVQLADIYDALTTERTYKAALSPTAAIDVIRAETKRGWRDPYLTERFVDMLPSLAALDEPVAPDVTQLSLTALASKLNDQHRLSASPQVSVSERVDMATR
jgi:putative two-component system response regulator